MNRLASGASRVMALTVASAPPGLRDAAIASLSRSTAAFSPSETSVTVRDTSVAVSMARSAMPGWRDGPGVSIVIGQPFARIRMKPPPLAIRDRRRDERRVTVSHGETWRRELGSSAGFDTSGKSRA